MDTSKFYDKDQVKQAASGRWREILSSLCGLTEEQMDPQIQQPCVLCGGTDRYRAFDDFDETGGVFCNQCHNQRNSDGISTVQWMTGCKFPEALEKVASYLNIQPTSNSRGRTKTKADPAKDLEFKEWNELFAAHLCDAKPGVTEDSLKAQGVRLANYKGKFTVFAWPIIGPDLDPEKPVGWIIMDYRARPLPVWNKHGEQVGKTEKKVLFGSKSCLVGVDAVQKMQKTGMVQQVWKTEGITDQAAFWQNIPEHLRNEHVVISTSCGTNENPKWMGDFLSNFNVNLVHDADKPGQAGAEKWANFLAARVAEGKQVRNLQLPYTIEETHGKDSRDFFNEGNTFGDMLNLAETAEPISASEILISESHEKNLDLPEVELPTGEQTISDAGEELGELLAVKHSHFRRGGTVVRVQADLNGSPSLAPVKPEEIASDFEHVARLIKVITTDEGEVSKPIICRKSDASLILHSQAFKNQLPNLTLLSRSPVLTEFDGKLKVVRGYDPDTGILARGTAPEFLSLEEAGQALSLLLGDFRFATLSDRSRAIAALITPALLFGGLLPCRAPIDLGEADQSQSGKGYRNRLTSAIYGYQTVAINQQKGGVGSLEENFDAQLIAGQTFIAIDNVRGKIDSPKIESFLTEDRYIARAPFMPNTEIDPRRVYVMFTSNKAEITRDLANRSNCVRILKQPDGYEYREFPEGGLLQHVRANQSHFLGAVFTIVKEWHRRGKPRTKETRHDFREWAQTLDWIVQNLLEEAPLLDGHRETQQRMTTPAMNWLRDISIAVLRANQRDRLLTTSDLLDIIAEDGEIDIPGIKPGDEVGDTDVRMKALQQMGRKLKTCFRDMDRLDLGGVTITREERVDGQFRHQYRYQFTPGSTPSHPANESTVHPGDSQDFHAHPHSTSAPEAPPANNPPDDPLIDPLMNPRKPADPADGSCKTRARNGDGATSVHSFESNNGTISGSAGDSGQELEKIVIE